MLPINIARALTLCPVRDHLDDDFLVCTASDLRLPREPRRMECTAVGLCHSGHGSYTVGTVAHEMNPGDVIIIPEGQVLGDIRLDDSSETDLVLIAHDFLYGIIREVRDITNLIVFSRDHPVLTLTPGEAQALATGLDILRHRLRDPTHRFRRQVTGTLLATMIYDLSNAALRLGETQTSQARAQELFERYVRLVEGHFRRERRVAWYAERLGVSPKTLLEQVKRVSGRTPNEWLDTYTTLEIRVLLRNTTKPIKDIAGELAFASQSSLGKFFREHVGLSPKAYRQQQ